MHMHTPADVGSIHFTTTNILYIQSISSKYDSIKNTITHSICNKNNTAVLKYQIRGRKKVKISRINSHNIVSTCARQSIHVLFI